MIISACKESKMADFNLPNFEMPASRLPECDDSRAIRVSRLEDQGRENDLAGTTAAERMEMMWQLAVDAWAMKGEIIDEQAFPRHVVRVIRRGR